MAIPNLQYPQNLSLIKNIEEAINFLINNVYFLHIIIYFNSIL